MYWPHGGGSQPTGELYTPLKKPGYGRNNLDLYRYRLNFNDSIKASGRSYRFSVGNVTVLANRYSTNIFVIKYLTFFRYYKIKKLKMNCLIRN